jgi:putative ABC transport system permease protein
MARGDPGGWPPRLTRGDPGGWPPRLVLLGRLTGVRIVATAALALLTLGAVCAATAAPRKALATTTQALHQTLATASPLSQTITASAPWSGIANALNPPAPGSSGNQLLTGNQIGEILSQLHGDFNHGLVHLQPPATDWMSMTSADATALSSLTGTDGTPVKFEVSYRQPFSQYLRLVAGRLPGPVAPAPRRVTPSHGNVVRVNGLGPQLYFSPLIDVVVTSGTAAKFGLHPGSKILVAGPQPAFNGSGPITLEVTGIVAPRYPSATFWTSDATVVRPELEFLSPTVYYWAAGVIVGPSEVAAVQQDFESEGLAAQWLLPLSVGSPRGNQVQPLDDALTRLGTQTPALTGDVAPLAADFTITPNLLPALGGFLATEQAVDTLLWLLYVSLAVLCLVVFLLTARMIALRRSGELAIRRARGASLRQIALTTAVGAALACVPTAVVGAILAVLIVPGPAPPGGWRGPAGVLVVAVCAPPAFTAWQQRLPRRQSQRRSARLVAGWGRLVAEVTAIAASVAGLVVFRQQGIQPVTGVNLYTSAAPVLIAIPAVIVVLRVYPLALRAALLGAARRSGAPAFLGLARAARTRLTPALPAFALVLALSVAAFAGMVRSAVSSGDARASWQAAGADATISASVLHTPGATIDPAALRAAETVPGVTHAAPLWLSTWTTGFGQQVTGIVVDPAAYAALVATTETFPQVSAGLLKTAPTGSPQPVLASPQAAAELAGGVTLTADGAVDPIPVRMAGILSGTPALPAGGAFVIIPLSAVHSNATPPVPVGFNELLLSGGDIDKTRLTTVVRDMMPGGGVTFRSDILNSLTTAPLQHGTFLLFALAIVVAAGLGVAVMLIELALGAAEREATLARLTVMGLGEGQRARVVALELLPAVLAAAIAGWACAVTLPRIVAPAIDLSVFTGSPATVGLSPSAASVGWPLVALAVVALAALAIEIRPWRRGRLAASLRVGE